MDMNCHWMPKTTIRIPIDRSKGIEPRINNTVMHDEEDGYYDIFLELN